MDKNKTYRIADFIYDLEKKKYQIQQLIDILSSTEEYKEWNKESKEIPDVPVKTETTDEYIYRDNENIFKEMSEKSSNGWVGIEDWIDEVVKRKVNKYLHKYPDWYIDKYEKIPFWLRPDYNKPEPTCWRPDTDMFKVHPESGPTFTTTVNTGNFPKNETTILS